MSDIITNYKFSQNDRKFMNLALNLARKNVGLTSQNPSVCCVIVKDDIILSTGITSYNGRPHAEDVAISKATSDVCGSTIYVTLEPCSHFGQTNPCVDLIISKKISRIVIACQDPDERVNGKAIEKLIKNGIQTQVGLFEKEAIEVNRGFFSAKTINKPFVTLKLATSKDGKIAKKGDSRLWITNETSRKYGHHLRFRNNAILVGANTVKLDDPALNCRIEGLEKFSPIRIVLSTKLDLDLESKIFQDQETIKTYVATDSLDKDRINKFINAGIGVINFSSGQNLLENICKIGINNLLIEGGSKTAETFIKENLVDEIFHFQAKSVLGKDAIGAIHNFNLDSLCSDKDFTKISHQNLSGDCLTILRKNQ
jgi:diaminohydroxyphosphoribosylaminopyrimidine deaminase/5-amino-6-(5-phosphoribosylamino)uracil reductase